MPKPILISGIQPSGKLHIGNYLGALKNFVGLQNSGKYECYFFIADLHALTENPEAKNLRESAINLKADFLAVGLDPKKSTLFVQSKIQPVQELKWILSTLTPVSELLRMTAFKEKVLQPLTAPEREKITKEKFDEIVEKSNFGLAEYPILMAADILIYDAQFVPVGDDQLQHLELARTLARKFNSKFGKILVAPKPLLTGFSRVMSLSDPAKKMSKSEPSGCLFLDDKPEVIKSKVMKAVTDSGTDVRYDEKEKPGISNLLKIYSAFDGSSITHIEKRFAGKGYGDFKQSLAEMISEKLAPFQKAKSKLIKSPAVNRAFDVGAVKASVKAKAKLAKIKKAIGIA